VSRAVANWVGRNDDAMPTDAVRRRIYARQSGLCACGCTRTMDMNIPNSIDCDHIKPLIDGGLNVEANLQLLLREHHAVKTSTEATQRAEARHHQAKAFTRPPSKWQGPRFKPAKPQHRATDPVRGKYPEDIYSRRSDFGSNIVFTDEDPS
jgi:5-methylcytosine-specific restriction protein A